MPRGIKPKEAIDKILGGFIKKNQFTLRKADPPDLYSYIRTVENREQRLDILFDWIHNLLVQEGEKLKKLGIPELYKKDSYSHWFSIYLEEVKRGSSFVRLIIQKKYPHLHREKPEDILTSEQEEEREAVLKNDPMLNTFFTTQQELEEKLTIARQGLEKYGLPYLEEGN